jgi:hypothetical protein
LLDEQTQAPVAGSWPANPSSRGHAAGAHKQTPSWQTAFGPQSASAQHSPASWPVFAHRQRQPAPRSWPGGQETQAGPLIVLQTEVPAGQRQTPPWQDAPLQQV